MGQAREISAAMAEYGSISGAARASGVPNSSLSRSLAVLGVAPDAVEAHALPAGHPSLTAEVRAFLDALARRVSAVTGCGSPRSDGRPGACYKTGMVAIKNHEAERFLQRDVGSYAVFLLHGTDVGLVSERVRRIVRGLVDDPGDPFQLVRLSGEDLGGDAARLADEARTVPLFGGRRAVLVDAAAARRVEAAVDLLLAVEGACPVVIAAGNLKKDAPLRKAVERSRTAAAVECYPDGEREIAALVDAEAAAAGLAVDADARTLLVSLLGSDRLASRSEIGKLLLYAHGGKTVTAEQVVEAVADASAQANDDALDAAFCGDLPALDAAMNKLHLGPVEAGLLLSAALRHATALHRAKLAGPGGESPFRFGLSPKRRAAVERQLALLGPDALARAIVRLGEGLALVRREPRLAVDHATRVLWAVARSQRSRGARG